MAGSSLYISSLLFLLFYLSVAGLPSSLQADPTFVAVAVDMDAAALSAVIYSE